ncbi:Serine protease [Phytophthora megakarya]|uniref:Serine protease n=1 Tax=Phytophthora megakarya TaxID=4795 RepID=A0A225WWH0_9STRA|nr:Serine protease [Phytophthora megakarya]
MAQEPMKRPRVAMWKIASVLVVLVLLTPLWIAYGCLGVFFAENGADLLAKLHLGGCKVALLLAQWKLDQLLVFHLNQKPTERCVNVSGTATLVVLALCSVSSWRTSVENFEELSKHYDVWEYVNDVMVEALEKWRRELKIEKFYLGGHSMGAMFATSYTTKFPDRVLHLALISPAGVGYPPASKGLPLGLRIFRTVWNLRLTPMSVARLIPIEALAAYWYNNWALEKSGEIAMHSHLLPGAYAKRPLCEMLTPENIQVPITFLYGGGPDWMSSSHGEKVAKTFKGKQSVEVVLVPGAGHQLFMDNAPAFNEMLLSALSRSLDAEAVLLVAGMTTEGRLWRWVPASYAKLEAAERKILARAIPTPFEMKKVAQLGTVVVPCSDEKKREQAKNLVLIHGFAGGNPVWAMNLEKLSKHFNVYAVEWIGVGRSDRPDFNFKDYDSADDFIVGSFEKWQQEMELEKFDLCGHSMGAIFASAYALRNPEHVNAYHTHHRLRIRQPKKEKQLTARPYGPKLVQNVVQRRTSFMSEGSAMRDGRVDLNELAEYMYHNWALKPSGERAMTTHLAPGAHAVRPLVDVLLPEKVKMPLTFIYGEYDWMDYRNGLDIVESFKKKGHSADLYRVPNGGHQMFMENPDDFSRILIGSLTN